MLLTIVFIVFAILSYYDKDNDVGARFCVVIFGLISIVFSVTTSDFPIYKTFYNDVESLDQILLGNHQVFVNDSNNFEFGYKALNSFFKMFVPYVEVLYICCNLSIVILLYVYFRNKADNFYKLMLPYFAFFFIGVEAGIIRQAIAVVIFYFSLIFVTNKKVFFYLLITVICMLFHLSAIILPLLYFIINRTYPNKILIITFCIGLLLYLQIIPYSVSEAVSGLSEYLLPNAASKLVFYLTQAGELGAPKRLNLSIFENTAMFFTLLLMKRRLQSENKWTEFLNICLNLSLIYIFLYLYFFELYTFIYRVNYYFIFFKFFIIVKYIENEVGWKRIYLNTALVMYCAIMMISKILQGH